LKAGEYPVRASDVPSTWAGAVVDSFRAAVTTFVAPVTSVVRNADAAGSGEHVKVIFSGPILTFAAVCAKV